MENSYLWQCIDFKIQLMEYMKMVFFYCLEGNIDIQFCGQDNLVRKWYYVFWLYDDGKYFVINKYIGNGCEYIYGLIREWVMFVKEMNLNQDVLLENWVVGMYNFLGGYIIG